MADKKVVHVVGTGTIGEPLIGLLVNMQSALGIDEVTFHKRTPLLTDRSKVKELKRRGAKLAVNEDSLEGFKELGIEPHYEAHEALERASVVIDCTPVGNQNKVELYNHAQDPGENRNIADEPGNRELVQRLHQQLAPGWRDALPVAR